MTQEGIQQMSKRIMVVDDSRLVRVQMEDVLAGTEYEIAAYCRSGEDAIARYAEVQPDLVTMDIIMPGMDGLETARTILEAHPEAKIVMVSSLAYDDTIEEASIIGTKGFLCKPLSQDGLIEALEQVLHNG